MLLALDTVFSACSVALADPKGSVLATRHLEQSRGQAETLVPMAEEVLREAKIAPTDITRIIVTTGPGTFAGVRIGVAFARSLALATGASVLGLSSFEALAGAVVLDKTPTNADGIIAIMPGKRDEVSLVSYGNLSGDKFPPKAKNPPETIPIENLKNWMAGKKGRIVGPRVSGLPGMEEFEVNEHWITGDDLIKIAQLFPKDAFGDSVSPYYLRAPDATPQKSPISHG